MTDAPPTTPPVNAAPPQPTIPPGVAQPQDHHPAGGPRFGSGRKPKQFWIGDDETPFTAAATIPADTMLDLVERFDAMAAEAETTTRGGRLRANMAIASDLFDTVLYPESAQRLQKRRSDPENPVGLVEMIEAMQWLIGEAYGIRPTQPPSSSPTPPGDTGPASTDGQPAAEPTPEPSPGTDSSTSSTTG